MLMYGVEGIDVAERFSSVTAFVLTYRMSPLR
jgi:hypothetical protein